MGGSTVVAMGIALAFRLCLALDDGGWGQTSGQSPTGSFRVSMEPTVGQLVVDAVLIVVVTIVLGWVDASVGPTSCVQRAPACGRTSLVPRSRRGIGIGRYSGGKTA